MTSFFSRYWTDTIITLKLNVSSYVFLFKCFCRHVDVQPYRRFTTFSSEFCDPAPAILALGNDRLLYFFSFLFSRHLPQSVLLVHTETEVSYGSCAVLGQRIRLNADDCFLLTTGCLFCFCTKRAVTCIQEPLELLRSRLQPCSDDTAFLLSSYQAFRIYLKCLFNWLRILYRTRCIVTYPVSSRIYLILHFWQIQRSAPLS